jgi:hypothetical protein
MYSEKGCGKSGLLHLMYVTKLSCTCRKRIKGRKENKKKGNKTKETKLDT